MYTIRELTADDLTQLKNIAPPEWNTDLSVTFSFHFGQPYFYPIGCEVDGRVVGCANALVQGNTGWFGNIIVLPDFRGQGIGQALTQRLVDFFENQGVDHQVLIATKLGERVYRKLGFAVVSQYIFLKREAAGAYEEAPGTRALQPEDASAVFELDRLITGEERQPFLSRFLSDAWVHTGASGQVDGYYLPRLAHGPILAANNSAGLALLGVKLNQNGQAVVVPEGNLQAVAFLQARGFTETARAPRMCRGRDVAWHPEHVYARGSGFCG